MFSVLFSALLFAAEPPKTYQEACDEALRRKLPLVTYVNILPDRHLLHSDNTVVYFSRSGFDGYPEKCIIVACPRDGQLVVDRVSDETEPVVIRREEAIPDALAEVNAKRARKGLRPLAHDPLLTIGAQRVSQVRAQNLIAGHTQNDFAYLPQGAQATAGGCGALEPSWGWETCCYDDPKYTVGGAAWVWGRDGKRYMSIFVR